MSDVKIDRETAEKLIEVCNDPDGWCANRLIQLREKLRAALDAPQPARPETARCPRCGIGVDTDGDGDCAFCARRHHPQPDPSEAWEVDDSPNYL